MSSGGFWFGDRPFAVAPRGGLVVAGAGLEAAVQDADQPVPELAQGCVVTDPAPAQGVVVDAGTG